MKIAEIEYTPNPNAVKFVLKETLTSMGQTRSFTSLEAARGVPLAEQLMSVPHIVSAFFSDRFITVTQSGEADWPGLLRQLAEPIRAASPDDARPSVEALAAGLTGGDNGASASGAASELEGVEGVGEGLDDPRVPMIQEVLEYHIMPFLAADGGGLEILGLHNNRVLIRYQGACGTCPSSLTGTLMAIENLVQMEVDPELEVVTL
jgi:Fe-S cluster biogenesis protein NfuA